MPDGSIRIIGTSAMQFMLQGFDDLYTRTHPGTRFTLQLKGGYIALPQLTYGLTAVTPMAREVTTVELAPYQKIVGEDPLIIRVAHGTVSSQTRTAPLAIYVNKANPILKLTVNQLSRIFSSGAQQGDVTRWGQLGLSGEWKDRPIHTVGTPEASGFGSYMVRHVTRGRAFVPGFTALLSSAEIVKAVGEDVNAIGFCALDFATDQTRIVPLAVSAEKPGLTGTAKEVIDGTYPLDRYVFLFIRRAPGKPLDPFVREYLRIALSRQGQQIVASEPDGFLPLNATEVAEELSKLQ